MGSPIQHLYTQYRMASDIMAWPNQYFYGGKLKCGSQDRRCPIINYKLMNLEDSQQECHGSLIGNPSEAKFVAGLAKYVKRELERAEQGHKSVGILTFYNKQRRFVPEYITFNIQFRFHTQKSYMEISTDQD